MQAVSLTRRLRVRASSFMVYTTPMATFQPQTARQRLRLCTPVLKRHAAFAGQAYRICASVALAHFAVWLHGLLLANREVTATATATAAHAHARSASR